MPWDRERLSGIHLGDISQSSPRPRSITWQWYSLGFCRFVYPILSFNGGGFSGQRCLWLLLLYDDSLTDLGKVVRCRNQRRLPGGNGIKICELNFCI